MDPIIFVPQAQSVDWKPNISRLVWIETFIMSYWPLQIGNLNINKGVPGGREFQAALADQFGSACHIGQSLEKLVALIV
jgi:hypothetical protein